jgi:hypothetical protein
VIVWQTWLAELRRKVNSLTAFVLQSKSGTSTLLSLAMSLTIYPYLLGKSCWVFDDPRTGLKEEAFVLGMSEMISRVVAIKSIPTAHAGFALTFDSMLCDHDVALSWLSHANAAKALHHPTDNISDAGNWYKGNIFGQEMVGWLCPALFLYFEEAPKTIYAKAEPLPTGIDPVWQVARDDPRARRFVSAP